MSFRNERRKFPQSSSRQAGPKIGIALSCGGAKSLAHVGVIQVLEDHGIRAHAIAGSSMGAYIGALWAAGFDGRRLAELAAEFDTRRKLWKLADLSLIPRRGLVRGRRLRRLLERSLGDLRFSDLDTELAIVATRLGTLERKVIRRGRIVDAILASCAMPSIFVPVELDDGDEYVDGGLVAPLPVRELAEADRIVAVNTLPDARSRPARAPGLLGAALDAITAAQMRLAVQAARRADLVLNPVCHDGHWRDYANFDHYIELGRQAAIGELDSIRALAAPGPRPRRRGHFPLALSS